MFEVFDDLQELRYPFDNSFEFFIEGYWAKLEGLHLTLGWLFIIVFIIRLSRMCDSRSVFLTIPFFALAIFNNPAFNIAGIKLNEWFGMLAVLANMSTKANFKLIVARPIGLGLLFVFSIGSIHNLLLSLFYPVLNDGVGLTLIRIGVNFKVLVLGLNLLIIGRYLERENAAALVVLSIVNAGVFALLIYLLQIAILVGTGVHTYGSYLDAGFIGIPSFGSMSIERGHFGKFMAPLFPFFLYALLAWRWRLRFALFVLISCINFSASGQAFFAVFSIITLLRFRELLKSTGAAVGFCMILGFTGVLTLFFPEAYLGVVLKIYQLGILGDEVNGSGRSFGVLLQYLDTYPFGIGYSGSSLRTPFGMETINSGLYAFVTQFSILSLPILGCYIFLVINTIRVVNPRVLLSKAMSIGVLGSIFIFAVDILWFIPTIWLSFEMIWAINRIKINRLSNPKRSRVLAVDGA